MWNLEGEITDYFPGEDLAFHVAAEVPELVPAPWEHLEYSLILSTSG